MEIFIVVLILLLSIVISNILSRLIPFVPVPLIQIAFGIILGILPTGIHMPLEPELFMVLFIAPLLYNDGKMTSREDLWKLKSPVFLMSFGLVLVTVLVVGYIINLMIPDIPLSASFALAAILSPTDAVAVSSLSERIHLPEKIMTLLEGEALTNDASGLVAFRFAIAATVTGVFSFANAALSFFVIAIGGFLVGAVLALIIARVTAFIRRLGLEDATFHVLMQIISPFVIYLVSEELGLSGILAVVSGGIVYSLQADYSEPIISKLKFVSRSTWSVLIFIINGLVFLILGLQIPAVMSVIFRDDTINNFKVLMYIVVISLVLILLRFVWVYSLWNEKWSVDESLEESPKRFLNSVLTSLAGVRGAVTLAGAFSIPFYLENGEYFPQRDIIIFISAGVILLTICTASFVLPLLVKRENNDAEKNSSGLNQDALKSVMNAAIRLINDETNKENKLAASSLINICEKIKNDNPINIENLKLTIEDRKIEKDIFLLGIRTERKEVRRLLADKKIPPATYEKIDDSLTKVENCLSRPPIIETLNKMDSIKNFISKFLKNQLNVNPINIKDVKKIKVLTSKAAIFAIKEQINDTNRKASLAVIEHYNDIIKRLTTFTIGEDINNVNKQRSKLHLKALQAERDEVQSLLQSNEISRETALKLRNFINYMEATAIEEQIF
ncbi:Na+/H+ antiporter [Clostridium fungisolvens]|uniref:Sodium, potassium, lithium and rubidium/H(+) antiporter n=1 Tax=Clostridium fungisolvens TaxID=1604897 RepID=A0A6V8SCP3_9CLOT|nr:Na+/H+ antiporter [Clostridium fungisolvens]GFP74830.1 Sodium, potassium, lithium and rubidium/H(+) antiporter [Clostridium fungisolvens]